MANAQGGTWVQKANFGGNARIEAAAFSIGTKGYIGTGVSSFTPLVYYQDFWEYDPATDVWTQKADVPPFKRFGAIGFSVGSKGYIGLGKSSTGTVQNDLWEYNPSSNSWAPKANCIARRFGAVGFSIGNKGYIGTGNDEFGQERREFFSYNPSTNSWASKAMFGGTARIFAVGFSIGGTGYIGTGFDYNAPVRRDFWAYDTTFNTWILREPMPGDRKSVV